MECEEKINHERLRRELWIKIYLKTDVIPSYTADEAVRCFDKFFNKGDK